MNSSPKTLRHPNRKALTQWLNSDNFDSKEIQTLDQHIAKCARCADALERIDAADPASVVETESQEPISLPVSALNQALAAPEDLAERLESRVRGRLGSRMLMDVALDLFGAGVETSRILMADPKPNRSADK